MIVARTRKERENGRTKERTLMKVQAIGIRIITKKATRRMVETIKVARRNSTRKVSNAIIVKSGVILLMNVRARKC